MGTTRIDIDDRGVATLTLARPEKHNAMSGQMIADLHSAGDQLAADDAVRVVVLAAEGPTFCAGGDLGWMRDQMEADTDSRRAAARGLAAMLHRLNTLPKPLIGRVHGNAFGGGVGMMSVCDVAIGVEGTAYGLTETKLGLIPATIGPYVVARIGEAAARRTFLSSKRFDAAEAYRMGLLSQVVSQDDLDAAIAAEITLFLKSAPKAIAAAKAQIRTLGPVIDEATIAYSVDALIGQWESGEAVEGIGAFFEKRTPRWA